MDGHHLAERHAALMQQYLDPPHGEINRQAIEQELGNVETALLRYRPAYQDEKGIWWPRSTGLISVEQARAEAEPEGLKWLRQFDGLQTPRFRDAFQVIPEKDIPDAIAEKKEQQAENIHLIKFRLDQNGYRSCASAGETGCVMATQEKQGQPVVKLNHLALYRLVNGGRDGGSSLSDNIAAARTYGIPSTKVWPESKGWRTPLSDEAKHDALRNRLDEAFQISNKLEFITALVRGFLVYAGYSGHAWYAFDPIDLTRFWWQNSWGTDWGTNGASTLKFSSVAWYYGVWAIRTVIRPALQPAA